MTHQEANEASCMTITSEPFREKPVHVPYIDYERVVAENQKLRDSLTAAQKSKSRGETLGKVARGIGLFAVSALSAAIVVFAIWFVFVRGEAWGERARANATREATAFVTRSIGYAPDSVQCGLEDVTFGTMRCVAVYRSSRDPITLACDDDDPVTNDGCSIVYDAGGMWRKPIQMVPFNGGSR